MKKKIFSSLLTLSTLTISLSGADWLTIGGTEPDFVKKDKQELKNSSTKPHFWGFLQVGYQKDLGTILEVGGINKTPFVLIAPDLQNQSAFEVNRARLAVRGMIDTENTLNYFFMSELGNNGITNPAGNATNNHLTDASITYRGIPYVNVRVGQFKYPGSEEGMRAVFASEYRNFSTPGNQLLLERFIPNDATAGTNANGDIVYTATPTQSVGAYRDRGVELFKSVHIQDKLTLSLAGMLGSGTGLSSANASGELNYYAYIASEYLFGKKKGYFTEAIKVYAWYQDGKRKINNNLYDRLRYGLGIDYFYNGLRFDAEYIKAKGMIYNGAKDISSTPYSDEWAYQIAAEGKNIADGGLVSLQYYVVPKKVEIVARYDYLNRLTNSSKDERDYRVTTLGASYHFKGANRVDLNYAFREIEAPGNSSAQKVLDNADNLLSIQATIKF